MSSRPQQRYEVIERLDAGGMAEVFRGRAVSMKGFEKQVAIKRVLPNLAKNDRFVKMFLDEAKLSLHLDHANIVSVFDLGQSGDTYFIVMEYVDGANLKKVIEGARRAEGYVPTEIAVWIAAKVCEGLQYAHDKKGPDGRKLDIVHRDISPPNVLISNQGEVKLTDFGLAKATTQVELTDPGVVKGKFGYLSPEAARGEGVDPRTDVFATGILLWEMLAGKRLFQGQTDFDTLQQVRDAKVPPIRQFNARVPQALERIVLKALARDRDGRYTTARDLGRDLMQFLFSAGTSVTSYDLAAYMERVVHGGGSSNDPSKTTRDAMMNQAIQDEINRLIHIDNSAMGAAPTESSPEIGSLEDPRTWAGFAFDEKASADGFSRAPSGARYATVGGSDALPKGGTKVRTGPQRAVTDGPEQTPPPARRTPAPSRASDVHKIAGASESAVSQVSQIRPRPVAATPPPQPTTSNDGASSGNRVIWMLVAGIALVAGALFALLMNRPG